MARHYYLTRSGRLRRKDNTLCFEPSAEAEQQNGAAKKSIIEELFSLDTSPQAPLAEVNSPVDERGDEASPALAQDGGVHMLAYEMRTLPFEPDAASGVESMAAQETHARARAPHRPAYRGVTPIE